MSHCTDRPRRSSGEPKICGKVVRAAAKPAHAADAEQRPSAQVDLAHSCMRAFSMLSAPVRQLAEAVPDHIHLRKGEGRFCSLPFLPRLQSQTDPTKGTVRTTYWAAEGIHLL